MLERMNDACERFFTTLVTDYGALVLMTVLVSIILTLLVSIILGLSYA